MGTELWLQDIAGRVGLIRIWVYCWNGKNLCNVLQTWPLVKAKVVTDQRGNMTECLPADRLSAYES